MNLCSPCGSIQQTPVWNTAPHPATLTLLAPWQAHSRGCCLRAGMRQPCSLSLTVSRPTLRGSDQQPLVSADIKEATWLWRESPGEGALKKGKEKEQDFASSNSHNGKTNRGTLLHSILCKAITCFTESESHSRGGQRVLALIKFVQLLEWRVR